MQRWFYRIYLLMEQKYQHAKIPISKAPNKAGATIVLIVLALIIIGIVGAIFGDDKPEKVKPADAYTEFSALYDSRTFVTRQLKAPATAQFDNATTNVKKLNDTTFTVASFVDSQNSFGALLRSNYSCVITYRVGTDQVFCNGLAIE